MMKINKTVVLLDIRKRVNDKKFLNKYFSEQYKIVSVTPYSKFLSEEYYDSCSISDLFEDGLFHSKVLSEYKKIENSVAFEKLKDQKFYLRDIAKYITYDIYVDMVKNVLDVENVIYIHDSVNSGSVVDCGLHKFINFKANVKVSNRNSLFYAYNTIKWYISRISFNLIAKLIKPKYKRYLYDNSYFMSSYQDKIIEGEVAIQPPNNELKEIIESSVKDRGIRTLAKENIISNDSVNIILSGPYIPFTYLHNKEGYNRLLAYKKLSYPIIMMQHGSYLMQDYFIKYNEVQVADYNFVFNEYTRELFSNLGAKKAITVGSLSNTKPISDHDILFDFVYITYCTQYSYTGVHVTSVEAKLDVDAENIYARHKKMILLFGECFSDMSLCIKLQPGIMLGSMLYVPLVELAKKYKNITIEFITPLPTLYTQAKCIISDYFSSDFSNPFLVEDKKIYLFSDKIIKVKEDVGTDLKKIMKIITSVDDLKYKLGEDLSLNTKNKEHVEVIERYSSKRCNSYEIISENIEDIFNV